MVRAQSTISRHSLQGRIHAEALIVCNLLAVYTNQVVLPLGTLLLGVAGQVVFLGIESKTDTRQVFCQ